MRLLNTLRLLVRSVAPDTGVAPGAVYYDSTRAEPRYSDGTNWNSFGMVGFPLKASGLNVPAGRQLIYFDQFQNDGVLTIHEDAVLVGMR